MLADFLAEFTPIPEEQIENLNCFSDVPTWKLYVDDASNEQGRAGLILTSPQGYNLEYTLRFNFQASNNEAEYEVLIGGLNLALSMYAQQVIIHSGSQLVVK